MRKPFNAAQGGFIAIFRLKDDFRAGFGHDAALPRDAEFFRKVASDSCDDFQLIHGIQNTPRLLPRRIPFLRFT